MIAAVTGPVILWRYPPSWSVFSASPFCVKLEAWLRLTKTPYEARDKALPIGAPHGKLPVAIIDGETVADSRRILDHFLARGVADPDAGRTPLERARDHALARMVEEHLYWAVAHARWATPAAWPATRAAFLAWAPTPIRPVVGWAARAAVRHQLRQAGLGRLAPDTILHLAEQDLDTLAVMLGDAPYLGGPAPTTIDCIVFAFLATIIVAPSPCPLKDRLRARPTLVDFTNRAAAHLFPEAGRLDADP